MCVGVASDGVLSPSGLVDPSVLVEPLTEERAARTLYRIELLRKIREQVRTTPEIVFIIYLSLIYHLFIFVYLQGESLR